jgi:penicillin amidase
MLALQMDVSSTFDHFCADKFVYALDHAPKISAQAKRAADILRDWDGRMTADSAAPTIETKAREELMRLLLEPKLGPTEDSPTAASTANGSAKNGSPASELAAKDSSVLSWKSYRWGMSSVWLENVLSKQPPRWLPPGYSDYGAVLTAAIENTVKQPGITTDLAKWKWGANYRVEIDLELRRLRLQHAERGHRRERSLSQPALSGPMAGVVWRIDVHATVLGCGS